MGFLLGGKDWLEDEDEFEGMALAISGAMKEDLKREKEEEEISFFSRWNSDDWD